MSVNNLRIIYDNVLDYTSSTIEASSTASAATPVSNLKKDVKSLVWRSGTTSSSTITANFIIIGTTYIIKTLGTTNFTSIGAPSNTIGISFKATGVGTGTGTVEHVTKANLLVTFTSSIIGGVHLPFCNLSSLAKIRVRGYTGTPPSLGGSVDAPTITVLGTTVFDTGEVFCCPYQSLGLWNWGTLPLGANAYSYGGGTYGRVWVPIMSQGACTSISIEVIDPGNITTKYIEASRVVLGQYWSPQYNTSFGLSTTMKELSEHERSEAGDLVTNRGIRYNSMNFDLKWLTPSDRLMFTNIMRGNGLPKPIFISLFPDNVDDWEKEQSHQIYGKLSNLPSINHPVFSMYSTTIDIEEL